LREESRGKEQLGTTNIPPPLTFPSLELSILPHWLHSKNTLPVQIAFYCRGQHFGTFINSPLSAKSLVPVPALN